MPGNCDPPKEYQFKPGQSGNPAGKAPGTFSLKVKTQQILNEEPEQGEAIIRALVTKALDGDVPAIKELKEWIDGKETQRTEIRDLNKDFVGKVLEGLREGAKAKGIEKEMDEILGSIEIPDEWMK